MNLAIKITGRSSTTPPRRARLGTAVAGGTAEFISIQIAAIEAELAASGPVVIDLAVPHPEGGFDVLAGPPAVPTGTRLVIIGPPAQILVREEDCDGPLAVVHGRAGLDVALTEPQLAPCPPRGGYLIKTCPGCEVQPHLEQMDSWTALVLTHEGGCPELARLLRGAGEDR